MFKFFFNQFLLFAPKEKKDDRGICYVVGLRRYTTVFLDLLILLLLLYATSYGFNYLFAGRNDKEVLKVMKKYSMQVSLTQEEVIIKDKQIKLVLVNQLVQLSVLFLYIILMWIKFAATPAKLLFGFRIVDEVTLQKITFGQAVKRLFASALSATPLFLGFIWANFDKHGRAWHDKIACTVVVTSKSLRDYYRSKSSA
ncbi:MAG: hypothetical protein sL5_01090 [Candidatus Mesenet longicola]|uniref:RDD domain-containing protein n=1 Tax=Candidatus Mesenet longicola TaxID=1892558 RepID=A0A8J3HWY1_9RICK|nr:MAG: hypothetical protein sGL2_01270 [Candidatus Mesenet longicola]GHM59116.1 MAG: hypothetical protein sL5_01090 [Candidatus Mesenet longicola]